MFVVYTINDIRFADDTAPPTAENKSHAASIIIGVRPCRAGRRRSAMNISALHMIPTIATRQYTPFVIRVIVDNDEVLVEFILGVY